MAEQDTAVYQSIALDIAQRIVSGEFPAGCRISGRSLLAGQYHVSPETIRKAIGLLKDENIVSVSQGKEIVIVSEQKAYEYITKHQYLKSAYSLKQELQQLLQQKRDIDRKFDSLLTEIVETSDRLKNLKPYNPVEIRVRANSYAEGKTIGDLQFWQNTGATIIALRRGTQISISPGPHVILLGDDVLVIVGSEKAYERTEAFINQARETE
jgi:K+/H+ antiporter YhaU regulatory subunit KhtT